MSIIEKPEVLNLPSDQDGGGRQLGDEEISLLHRVIDSGVLTSTKGTMVRDLELGFAKRLEMPHAVASCSGTSALHIAFAAINPEPGDEFITTSITDMGALTPILYQGAIPVFADVDPRTCNVTAETIAARLSPKTKAIIVTHLFGQPCKMAPIMDLAKKHNIPVIEDCSQAFLASEDGVLVGTFGDIGCFSLQQGKHITTGEGGICVTRRADLARHMRLFVNKAWGYGDPNPDHYFLALNYRMNEITGAVGLAQLGKLDNSVTQRSELAALLNQLLADIDGLSLPIPAKGTVHTYWKYVMNVDANKIPGGCVALAAKLKVRGIFSAPRYIQKPAFRCQVFQDQRTFGNSRFPFTLARPEAVDYRDELFPGTLDGLASVLVLPWNERYTTAHVRSIAQCVREEVAVLQKGNN